MGLTTISTQQLAREVVHTDFGAGLDIRAFTPNGDPLTTGNFEAALNAALDEAHLLCNAPENSDTNRGGVAVFIPEGNWTLVNGIHLYGQTPKYSPSIIGMGSLGSVVLRFPNSADFPGITIGCDPNGDIQTESYSGTVTISNASPAVVSWTAHGRSIGDKILFSTTGALPTGLSTNTTYFVISAGLTANAFQVSARAGGPAINTSSAGSGTHTAYGPYTAGAYAIGVTIQNIAMLMIGGASQRGGIRARNSIACTLRDIHIRGAGQTPGGPWHERVGVDFRNNSVGEAPTPGQNHQHLYMERVSNHYSNFGFWFGEGLWSGTIIEGNANGCEHAAVYEGSVVGWVGGNCQGGVYGARHTSGAMYTTGLPLTTSSTVTISNASPAVVTWTAHGLVANSQVVFTTTGALPTGLSPDVTYYVIAAGLTANEFQVSATQGGAAIDTSSAGSGTHTATNSVSVGTPVGTVSTVTGLRGVLGYAGSGGPITYKGCWLTLDNDIYRIVDVLSPTSCTIRRGGTITGSTVTISNGSPAVVTWTGHNLAVNSKVVFATSGTLPTGLSPNTQYYVISAGLGVSTFQVSATQGGAAINTSSAGSGTHTASVVGLSYGVRGCGGGNEIQLTGQIYQETSTGMYYLDAGPDFTTGSYYKIESVQTKIATAVVNACNVQGSISVNDVRGAGALIAILNRVPSFLTDREISAIDTDSWSRSGIIARYAPGSAGITSGVWDARPRSSRYSAALLERGALVFDARKASSIVRSGLDVTSWSDLTGAITLTRANASFAPQYEAFDSGLGATAIRCIHNASSSQVRGLVGDIAAAIPAGTYSPTLMVIARLPTMSQCIGPRRIMLNASGWQNYVGFYDTGGHSTSFMYAFLNTAGPVNNLAPLRTSTVTISNASPAVVSWTAHGLVENDQVVFTTTGTLPTGLSPNVAYYVISAGLTADEFQVSATQGGAAINTSSAGSGTHTASTSGTGGHWLWSAGGYSGREAIGAGSDEVAFTASQTYHGIYRPGILFPQALELSILSAFSGGTEELLVSHVAVLPNGLTEAERQHFLDLARNEFNISLV